MRVAFIRTYGKEIFHLLSNTHSLHLCWIPVMWVDPSFLGLYFFVCEKMRGNWRLLPLLVGLLWSWCWWSCCCGRLAGRPAMAALWFQLQMQGRHVGEQFCRAGPSIVGLPALCPQQASAGSRSSMSLKGPSQSKQLKYFGFAVTNWKLWSSSFAGVNSNWKSYARN